MVGEENEGDRGGEGEGATADVGRERDCEAERGRDPMWTGEAAMIEWHRQAGGLLGY